MNEEEIRALREGLVASVKAAMAERDTEVTKALQRAEENVKQYGVVQENTKQQIAELTTKGGELASRMQSIEQKLADIVEGQRKSAPTERKSIGQQFIDSGVVQKFAEEIGHSGKGSSKPFQVKAITSVAGSGADGVQADRRPDVVILPMRPLSVRDLIASGSTQSNAVEFVRELLFTNSAAPVAENTTKPESDLTFELVTAGVKTIAHWINASRQILSDFKQLQTIVDQKMGYGLKIKEEDQLLLGDGTGQNLHGLIPQATSYNTALNRAGDTMLDVLRHAILQVRLAFYPATGIVLTPTDWTNIQLMKDNENRYLFGSPAGNAPPMIWGLPVAECDALPDGDFLTGAFRLAATVYDREQASIMVSTENSDNFVKNMVTILCEERLVLTVERPAAFVHGGWPQGASTG